MKPLIENGLDGISGESLLGSIASATAFPNNSIFSPIGKVEMTHITKFLLYGINLTLQLTIIYH